jgi:rubrerythrin
METIIDRDFCIRHPRKIIGLFGLDVYLGLLFNNGKSLLERLADKYSAHGLPMPGPLGNAYKLSALFEFRVARIYRSMAERFKDQTEAHDLFMELSEEEMEHGRLMLVCYYTVELTPSIDFIPSVRDPAIRDSLNELRELERRVDSLSLKEALEITIGLEKSEVNVIFGKLLSQVDKAQSRLFVEQFKGIEGHSESVPRRISELRQAGALPF